MPGASTGGPGVADSGLPAAAAVAEPRIEYNPWRAAETVALSAGPDGSVLLNHVCLGTKNYWFHHFASLRCSALPPLPVPAGSGLEDLLVQAQNPTAHAGQTGAREAVLDLRKGVLVEELLHALGDPLAWCSFDDGYAESVVALYAPQENVAFVVFDDGGGGLCLSYLAAVANSASALRWFTAHLPESAVLALSASVLGVSLDRAGPTAQRGSVCSLVALENSCDAASGERFSSVQQLRVGQCLRVSDGYEFPVVRACAQVAPAQYLSLLDARVAALVTGCSRPGRTRAAWLSWCVASQLDGGDATAVLRDVGVDASTVETIVSLAPQWTGSWDELVRASRLLCETP